MTTLLVCVTAAKESAGETLQSLQFGSRAMCVKNKPVVSARACGWVVVVVGGTTLLVCVTARG